jgi:hypothetical protein
LSACKIQNDNATASGSGRGPGERFAPVFQFPEVASSDDQRFPSLRILRLFNILL